MKLAINGGTPISSKRECKWPVYDDNTKNHVNDVFESNRWTISGLWKGRISKCQEFEKKYSVYNNIAYCVLFDHGSSSLVAALQALGVGPGDEVIIPALTWVACIIAVIKVNAIPIIVDVDETTYCISIDKIKSAINKNTKVIMPVHLYGCMANMDEIMYIAQKNNIFVVEDASHSHGSIWNERRAGTIGDIGCFSFQQGKPLTCGEGGAVLIKDKETYLKLQELRTNSRVYRNERNCHNDRMQLEERGKILGTNYCISEFQAAILIDQLDKLQDQNIEKEKNALYLDKYLSEIPGVNTMYRYPQIMQQTYYRYCIKIDNRYFSNKAVAKICNAISKEVGFDLEQPYVPINKSTLFRPKTLKENFWSGEYIKQMNYADCVFPIAEHAAENEGIIFHHSFLLGEHSNMDKIIEGFYKVQKYSDEI